MKQIRLAIIGCGGFVRSHVRAINDHVPEVRIVALCDIIKAHADRLRRDLPPGKRPAFFIDYRDLLAEVKPDAVIVSTPHTLHFRHAYDSLGAGAHVMVDKPMVTDSAQARRLVARSAKTGLALNVAIQGTHTDTFAYARQLIGDGTMGELQLVTGVLAQDWLDLTRGWWRQDPKLSGGGQLYDSMAHVLSAMMFLVGSPVAEVQCFTDYKGSRVDINAVGCIRFRNGTLGAITCGGNCAAWHSALTLQGRNALMEISPHGGGFRVLGQKMPKPITRVPRGWKIPTVTPARNFADVILGRAEPRCGGHLGILLADLMDALYASAAAGRPVKVNA